MWNHRVIQYPDGYCEIVEMHYEDDGSPQGYTPGTICFDGGYKKSAIKQIEWLKTALEKPFISVDDDGLFI